MANGIATSILNALSSICGGHATLAVSAGGLPSASSGLPGPVLGNILVVSAAGLVTLFCFVIAFRLLISPGERDPSHPKYRILSDDR